MYKYLYIYRCGDEDIRGAFFKALEVLVDVCAPYDHLCSEGVETSKDEGSKET
jgi:hypothetical protein